MASCETSTEVTGDNHILMESVEAVTSTAHTSISSASSATYHDKDSNKRTSSDALSSGEDIKDSPASATTTNKRPKLQALIDPKQEQRQHQDSYKPPNTLSHIHSASALFRRQTPTSPRKHTRPPMSKVFMSLQLTPESFLDLQSLAKTYMLDPSHPLRQNCVGNRGKGDTDIVKLRLFNCVREFLQDGVGESFFGEYVRKVGRCEITEVARALGEEDGGDALENVNGNGDGGDRMGKELVWPRDGNRIITLVTPLMRRMVTNERQRRYAIETRRGVGAGRKRSKGESGSGSGSERGERTESPVVEVRGMKIVEETTAVESHGNSEGVQSEASTQGITAPVPMLVEPVLTNINVFLVRAKPVERQAQVSNTKLAEKRINGTTYTGGSLVEYSWNNHLRQDVLALLKQANHKTSSVSQSNVARGNSSVSTTHATENLEGVAVAARALNSDDDGRSDLTDTPLSHCRIKTLGEKGWEDIIDGKRWARMLKDRACQVWCDGIVNVVVEVLNDPARGNGY